MRCFICGSEEHFKKEFPEYKKKKKQRDQSNQIGLLTRVAHFTCVLQWTSSVLMRRLMGQILLGNNKACKVMGIGTVTLKL